MLPRAAILVRTEKAMQELRASPATLARELRMFLFFIDDRTRVEVLVTRTQKFENVEQSLQQLLDDGYLQIGGVSSALTPLNARLAEVAASSQKSPREKMMGIAQAMLRGPALEKVLQKIESTADTPVDWEVAIAACKKFIVLFVGEKEAADFVQKAKAVMGT
jgi:hypothetical protein